MTKSVYTLSCSLCGSVRHFKYCIVFKLLESVSKCLHDKHKTDLHWFNLHLNTEMRKIYEHMLYKVVGVQKIKCFFAQQDLVPTRMISMITFNENPTIFSCMYRYCSYLLYWGCLDPLPSILSPIHNIRTSGSSRTGTSVKSEL